MIKNLLYSTIEERILKDCDSIYIISDTHFSDFDSYRFRHLLKVPDKKDYLNSFKDGDIFETYETHVNKLLKQADEDLVKKINSVAGKNSCLIILGDVGNVEYVKKLRAKYKILIMGNHEKGASNYKRHRKIIATDNQELVNKAIDEAIAEYTSKVSIDTYKNGDFANAYFKTLEEKKLKYCIQTSDNKLFDEVYEGPLMISDRIILSHEPIIPLPNYLFNIHGHIHDEDYKGDKNHLNLCAEAIGYKPVNLLSLIKNGLLKNIPNIHRPTIDTATERKKKRAKK